MKETNDIDNELKALFQSQLKPAPQSPWFTRKVLNRLPRRKTGSATIIEYCGFAIAAVVMTLMWYSKISAFDVKADITLGDVVNYLAMTTISIALIAGFITMQLRKL